VPFTAEMMRYHQLLKDHAEQNKIKIPAGIRYNVSVMENASMWLGAKDR
jgi:hypothetical protein